MELITLTREQYREDLETASLRAAEIALSRAGVGAPAPPLPTWLPTKEAAHYLRVSVSTLQAYRDEEGSPIETRPGRGRRAEQYLRSSLDAYREKQSRKKRRQS